jgi:hypothetical protein
MYIIDLQLTGDMREMQEGHIMWQQVTPRAGADFSTLGKLMQQVPKVSQCTLSSHHTQASTLHCQPGAIIRTHDDFLGGCVPHGWKGSQTNNNPHFLHHTLDTVRSTIVQLHELFGRLHQPHS